jgi:hypothetical protein
VIGAVYLDAGYGRREALVHRLTSVAITPRMAAAKDPRPNCRNGCRATK